MIQLAVAGAVGRMGRCVLDLVARDKRFDIAAALTAPGCPMSGKAVGVGNRDVHIAEQLDTQCDVLMDFSLPAGTMAWLDVCDRRKIPMVIGVTGHDDAQSGRIRETARRIPIVLAANFSVGINSVLDLVGPLARALGDRYDIEIVESHHRHKVDAPSGTALAIVDEIRREQRHAGGLEGAGDENVERERPPKVCHEDLGRALPAGIPGPDQSAEIIFGRHGRTGERPARQIAVHAVRMGDLVGQHEIHFSGCGETITIRHVAHSRETFAAGALRAAAWTVGRPRGLYSMRDVLRCLEQCSDGE